MKVYIFNETSQLGMKRICTAALFPFTKKPLFFDIMLVAFRAAFELKISFVRVF